MHKIDGQTKLFGILGNPVSHSFSPELHNAAFAYYKMNAVYVPFKVKDLKNITSSLLQLNILGISITIPYKVEIMREVKFVSSEIINIGATNTMVWHEISQVYKLYNTDVLGAMRAITSSGFSLEGKNVLLLGTGGSAKAIGYGLINEKINKLAIVGRSLEKVGALEKVLEKVVPSIKYEKYLFSNSSIQKQVDLSILTPEISKEFDLIIQTTPLGMSTFSEKSILEEDYFSKHQVIFDIVYSPHETYFLQLAKKKGCQIIYGIEMLLYQACEQFFLFTNKQAPEKCMRSVLKDFLV